MAGEFTYGFNQKDKESFWETGMKVTGQKEFEKDLEHFTMRMVQNIKEIGRKTWKKEKDTRNFKMVQFTKDSMLRVSLKDLVDTSGQTGKFTKVSG